MYGFFYIYYPSNKTFSATLFFKYREINEETTISLASNEGVNFVELEEVESVSSFTEATKEKPVGEKAKGEIRIYNTTNEIKEVTKGTKLTCISGSCKSLVYQTQNKLNLSPGGVDDVAVVAADIGENYNLSAGSSRFQVGSYNSDTEVFGSNLQGITGGTPKEFVKIVAKQDIKRAEDEAMKAVKNLLLSTIKNNPSHVDYIISDSSLKVEKISS
ncbi:MAG: baseplate J/gp47 family protein, partial [Candidatus Dojkabacteria bacterium]